MIDEVIEHSECRERDENETTNEASNNSRRTTQKNLKRQFNLKLKKILIPERDFGRTKIEVEKNSLPISPNGDKISRSLPPTSIFTYFNYNNTSTTKEQKKAIATKKTAKPKQNTENNDEAQKLLEVNRQDLSSSPKEKEQNQANHLYFDYDMFKPNLKSRHKLRKTPLYLSNASILYRIIFFPIYWKWWMDRLPKIWFRRCARIYITQIFVTLLWLFRTHKTRIDYVEIFCPIVLFLFLILLLLYCVNMIPKLIKEQRKSEIKLQNNLDQVFHPYQQRTRTLSCQTPLVSDDDSGIHGEIESNIDEIESHFSFKLDEEERREEVSSLKNTNIQIELSTTVNNRRKERLTREEIAREVNIKVNKADVTSKFTSLSKVVCYLTAMAPLIARVYMNFMFKLPQSWADLLDIHTLFDLFSMLTCGISTYFVSSRILNELCVAEVYLKRKYLFAKYFKKMSSKNKAKAANLPYFMLDSPANVFAWASLRCQVSTTKLLNQESSRETISFVAHVTVVLWLFILTKDLFLEEEDTSFYDMFFNLPGSIFIGWLGTFTLFCIRYQVLYWKYLRKMNSFLRLQNEVMNITFELADKSCLTAYRKTELKSALDLLKRLIAQIKAAEPEYKISNRGSIMSPLLSQCFSILLVSYCSTMLVPILGYNPRLHKISLLK